MDGWMDGWCWPSLHMLHNSILMNQDHGRKRYQLLVTWYARTTTSSYIIKPVRSSCMHVRTGWSSGSAPQRPEVLTWHRLLEVGKKALALEHLRTMIMLKCDSRQNVIFNVGNRDAWLSRRIPIPHVLPATLKELVTAEVPEDIGLTSAANLRKWAERKEEVTANKKKKWGPEPCWWPKIGVWHWHHKFSTSSPAT